MKERENIVCALAHIQSHATVIMHIYYIALYMQEREKDVAELRYFNIIDVASVA